MRDRSKQAVHRVLSVIMSLAMVLTTVLGGMPPLPVEASNKLPVYDNKAAVKKALGDNYDLTTRIKAKIPKSVRYANNNAIHGITHSDNLKCTNDDDAWCFKKNDQGKYREENATERKKLQPAYVNKGGDAKEGQEYWVQYNDVGIGGEQYDIRATFTPEGRIAPGDEYPSGGQTREQKAKNRHDPVSDDIAIFAGQLGAVRFRGFKKCKCEIDIYKRNADGTRGAKIDPGTMLYLRFTDIDCHQEVDVTGNPNLQAALVGSKLKPKDTDGSSVWYPGSEDEDDTTTQVKENKSNPWALRLWFKAPAADKHTLTVKYSSGGGAGPYDQTNGAFFSFDNFIDEDEPKKFSADVDKDVNGEKSYTVNGPGANNFTYNIPIEIDEEAENGTKLVMTDTFPNGVVPNAGAATIDGGQFHFAWSNNYQTLTVTADTGWLKTNPHGTYTVHVPATVNMNNVKAGEWHEDTQTYVFHNKAHLDIAGEGNPKPSDSPDVTVIVPVTRLEVDKKVDKYEHKMGDDVVWTITLHNKGKHTAFNPTLTDTIPPQYKVNRVDGGSFTGNAVTADGGDLPADSYRAMTIHTTANGTVGRGDDAANGVENYNTAAGDAWNNIAGLRQDDAEEYTNTAQLSIDKKIKKISGDTDGFNYSDSYEYEVGDKAQFTVELTNKHPYAVANNVVLTDDLPAGMKLDYDSVKTQLSQSEFDHLHAGTLDPKDELNGEANGAKNYTKETEKIKLTANKEKYGDNGFTIKTNYLPAGATETVTFTATATDAGNGKEDVNKVTAKADNNNVDKVEDDAEFFINTADLAITKKYVNPYLSKNDNRYDNEFRVYEKEDPELKYKDAMDQAFTYAAPNEQVHYVVEVTSNGVNGTIARDVNIKDPSLPANGSQNLLALNFKDMKITETDDEGHTMDFTYAGGEGRTFDYLHAGTDDVTNKLNPELMGETETKCGKITLTQQGNGWELKDLYLKRGWKLTIEYTANATEDVNGDRIVNRAYATCSNMVKDKDGKYVTRSDKTEVYINSPRLNLKKSTDSASDRYEVGDTVTYTITAANDARGTIARNMVFTDLISPDDAEKNAGVKLQKATISLIDQDGKVLDKNEITYGNKDGNKGGKLQDSNKDATSASGNYVSEIVDNTFKLTTSRFLINAANHRLWDIARGKDYSPLTLHNWNPKNDAPEDYANAAYTGNSVYDGGDIRTDTSLKIEYQMVITNKDLAGDFINNRARAISDEMLPVWTEAGVTPKAPNLTITKQADKHEFVYTVSRNPHYVVNIAQVRDNVTAKQVVVNDAFVEKDIRILPDTIKVYLNDQDITSTLKDKIKVNADQTGYDIETGLDLTDTDKLRIEYDTELQSSSIGKSLTNTVKTHAANALPKSATETITVKDIDPQLLITKSSDKKTYTVGETGHYTVTTTNNADNSVARNIVLADALEEKGEKIVKDSIRVADEAGKDITKEVKINAGDTSYTIETGKDLAQNQSFTVTYDVSFDNDALADLDVKNTAKSHGDNVKEVTADNTVHIIKPDLTVVKSSDKTDYSLGETAHYTVVVGQDQKDAVAYQVKIHDKLLNEGGKIQADSLKVVGPDGKDITKDVKSKEIRDRAYTIDTGLDLAKGQTITVTYDVLLDNPAFDGKQVPNIVEATAHNASAEAQNRVIPHDTPDGLTILKDSDPVSGSTVDSTGEYGPDQITYKITVTNNSKKDAANVMIKDTVPEGTKYVSGGKMQVVKEHEVVAFNIPELKAGESKTEEFVAKVTADGVTQKRIDNIASVKTLGKDADVSDLFSHVNEEGFADTNEVHHFVPHHVIPHTPKLKIEKTSDKKVYSVDDIGHYQAVVTQTEEKVKAENVVIKDALENEGATIVEGSIKLYDDKDHLVKDAKITLNDDKTGYTIESGQDLDYNKTMTVRYDVQFTRAAASEPQIRNVAKTSADNTLTQDPKYPDDPDKKIKVWTEDDNIVNVIAPTLTIEKTSDKDEYEVGETGEYTVKVTQPVKDATAKDVVIKDEFKQDGVKIDKDSIKVYDKDGKELTIDKIKTDDKSYHIDTGRDLAYNEFFTVKYKVLFESQTLANQTVLNEAKAKGSNTIITTTQKDITPVKVDEGLTAVKSSVPATGTQVIRGQKITYYIAVNNVGGKARENVLVLDAVPEKSTYVEDSAQITAVTKDGSVTSAGTGKVVTIDGKQYVSWTIPKIEAGQSGVVSYAVRVNSDAKESDIIRNVALVAPSDTHKDLDPDKPETWKPSEFTQTNETDHPLDPWVTTDHEVKVIAPDIIIEKSSDKETYKTGETAHYTVKVGNDVEGTEAENVEIRDSFQIEGMEIQKDSIKITDPDGKDITKAVDITMTNEKGDNSGYQIVTKRNLKTGQFFTVTYDAVIRDENLAGKEVENIAMAKADNATAKTTNKVTPKDIGGGIRAAKTSDPISGTQVKGGDTITYNITLLNDADEVNDHVYLMDQIPDLTGYVEGSAKVLKPEAENSQNTVTVGDGTDSQAEGTADTAAATEESSADASEEASEAATEAASEAATVSERSTEAAAEATTEKAAETTTESASESTTEAKASEDSSKKKTSFTSIINALIEKVTGNSDESESGTATETKADTTTTVTTEDIDDGTIRDPSILGEALTETGEKADVQDVNGKQYVTAKVSIPAGGRRIVQFKVTVNKDVDDHSIVKNVALVKNTDDPGDNPWTPDTFTPTNETDHPTGPWVPTDHKITPKDGVPNLTIQKKSDKAVYNVGETGHYTVVVGQEKEGVTAKNVVIRDAFQRTGMTINKDSVKIADPSGKDITKAVHITTAENSYQIDTGMDLKYGEKFTVTYDVTFNDASLAGQQVVNVAKAKADNAHAQTNNTVTPVKISDNLTALKTSEPASGTTVKQGDQITYHIALSNTGTVNKEHVYVMDEVPAKTSYVDGSASFSVKDNDKEGMADDSTKASEASETTADTESRDSADTETAKAAGTGSIQKVDGKAYICFDLGTVQAGKTVDAQFTVTVDKDATEEDVITNVALARSADKKPENPWNPSEYTPTNTTNHPLSNWVTTTHTVTLQNPEIPALGIEKTSDKTEYKAGETGHYTVTVTGKQGETKNVVITDSLQKDLGATIVDGSIKVQKKSVTEQRQDTAWDSATQKAAEAATETASEAATEVSAEKTAETTSETAAEATTEAATEAATEATTEAAAETSAVSESTADVTQKVKIDSTKTGYTVTTNDSLKKGEQFIVTYDVNFTEAAAGADIRNAASAYGDDVPPVNTDHTVRVLGNQPKLKVTKKSNKKTYKKGQTGKYTVTITNTEKGTTAKNVTIKDVFNNKKVSVVKSSIKIKDQNGKKVPLHWAANSKGTWYGFTYSLKKTNESDDYSPDLDYGKKIVITYKVKFNKASLVGKKLTNTATADADNAKKAKAKNTVTIKKASPKKTSGKENPSRRNGGSGNPGGSGSGGNGGGNNGLKGVQTGIESHEALFAAIAAILLSGALALKIRSRRKKKESSDEKF